MFEDDIVPTKDCLKYLEWGCNTYANDHDIMNISCYHVLNVTREYYDKVERSDSFGCWGWGTWKTRWDSYIKKKWSTEFDTWAGTMYTTIRGNRNEIRPLRSRVQNIGFEKSDHILTEEQYKNGVFTPTWIEYINDYDFHIKKYKEIYYKR